MMSSFANTQNQELSTSWVARILCVEAQSNIGLSIEAVLSCGHMKRYGRELYKVYRLSHSSPLPEGLPGTRVTLSVALHRPSISHKSEIVHLSISQYFLPEAIDLRPWYVTWGSIVTLTRFRSKTKVNNYNIPNWFLVIFWTHLCVCTVGVWVCMVWLDQNSD